MIGREKDIYAQSLPHGIQEALCGLTYRTFLLFELDPSKSILNEFAYVWWLVFL